MILIPYYQINAQPHAIKLPRFGPIYQQYTASQKKSYDDLIKNGIGCKIVPDPEALEKKRFKEKSNIITELHTLFLKTLDKIELFIFCFRVISPIYLSIGIPYLLYFHFIPRFI